MKEWVHPPRLSIFCLRAVLGLWCSSTLPCVQLCSLGSSFICLSLFSFLRSTLEARCSVSFLYWIFFLFSCQVLDCCGLWNDGVVFELYLCVLGSACASCEGYLTAVFGFISALSLHRCPRVIVCHHQGGDLLLLKMLLGSCSPAPSTPLPPSPSTHTHTVCVD